MFLQLHGSCPWKEHVYDIEKENQLQGLIKFVFYKDARGMFRVQAVSKGMDTFENRVSICEKYRGLRDDQLNEASGLKDGSFVHATGFIGGAWSQESAIKIAEASLKEAGVDTNNKPKILGKRTQ